MNSDANPYSTPKTTTGLTARTNEERVVANGGLLCATLLVLALLLSIPPLPLFFWVADGEPFFGPPRYEDLILVSASAFVGFTWSVLVAVVLFNMIRRRLGKGWLFYSIYAILPGGISILVVYLYGSDQAWFH